ncbi:hypothetical protein BV20DRAFT_1083614 [Pilatotrama ljubarskyi]|nr:hypothetical protein BV20DRAFT_1083614 [Pilatotrama ljubarskyi]
MPSTPATAPSSTNATSYRKNPHDAAPSSTNSEAHVRVKPMVPRAEEATPTKKVRKKRQVKPVGPGKCMWNGCGHALADGKDIWAHMKTHHNKGKDALVEGKAEATEIPVNGQAPPSPAQARVRSRRELEEGEIVESEEEELEPGEIPDDEGEEGVFSNVEQEAGPSQSLPASNAPRAGPAWAQKVRCRWNGCSSEMQLVALRRHIESKHIPLRGAFCPKGCGYWMNRGDMLSRHVEKCQHIAVPVKKEPEE